ncbi:MAG: 2-dehydropantoate 2-reductase [Eubacterium sp.]|nr:2-dehydropantoate 2-reductase [Eubacterium sp.]
MINNIGLIGAGSVGSAMFSLIHKADPEHTYLLAKGNRALRLREKGISVNNEIMHPVIYADPAQQIHLDLLIIVVKTYSLDSVMEDMADLISEDTILLPLQNGIRTTERLKSRFPGNRVLYGTVQRTDAHRIGHRVYYNTLGETKIGYADNREIKPEVAQVHERLKKLGINIKIYEDMRRVQWLKWMLNTGASQVAAETGVECGFFGMVPEIPELMALCMDEILMLAECEKVNVTKKDRDEIIDILISYPPDKKMSMLQDLEAGRTTEIEEYAGTVIELGKKHGIDTPINKVLYLAITAREKIGIIRRKSMSS